MDRWIDRGRDLALKALIPICLSCAGPLEQRRGEAICLRLDSRRQAWSVVATSAGALAGGQGLASIPEQGPTSEDTRTGLQIGAVVAAAVAAGASVAQEQSAQAWARRCAR